MGNQVYERFRNIDRAIDRARINGIDCIAEALNDSVIDLKREIEKLYDKYLDQFYAYRTTSYYRHGTGKGTGTGINLYRANDIKIKTDKYTYRFGNESKDYVLNELVIEFDPSNMEEYKGTYRSGGSKKQVDREFVFDQVLDGNRGLPGSWGQSWEGEYESEYFEFSGIMRKAIEEFMSEEDEILYSIFKKNLGDKLKNIISNLKEVIIRNIKEIKKYM